MLWYEAVPVAAPMTARFCSPQRCIRMVRALAGFATCLALTLPASGQDRALLTTHPFEIVGQSFIALQVPDVDEATSWYAATLDLDVVRRLDDERGRHSIVLLERPGLTVELIWLATASPAREGIQHGLFKAGFWVRDLEAAHTALLARGVDADARSFVDEALRARSFVFRDPWGNRLQMFERIGPD